MVLRIRELLTQTQTQTQTHFIDVFWRQLYLPVTAFLGFRNHIGASEPFLSQCFGTRFRRKNEPGGYKRINGSTGPSIIPEFGVNLSSCVSTKMCIVILLKKSKSDKDSRKSDKDVVHVVDLSSCCHCFIYPPPPLHTYIHIHTIYVQTSHNNWRSISLFSPVLQ